MANNLSLGIGPSGLESAEEHLDGQDSAEKTGSEKTADEPQDEQSGDEPMNEEGDPAGEMASEESVPEPDDVAGKGGQTVVTTQSAGNQEVQIQCGATSCVFNRQHNCEAGEVHISFNPNKGMRSAATQCDTYQTAPVEEEG
ncbi:DUF1540 domain-containing protein [Salinibacter ruber]|jgi:hypothetical protein|uniref:DUF1540 domain-containing protein n=1 Tax=Salinibacter ruber TaxID=146919 RepID=A0AAW5P8M8_9BACT|nr:DUF1540 domain-containing protein [Salinibacter ruber]MCS4157770.1 hypothetical protein [Salinibacter ruber]